MIFFVVVTITSKRKSHYQKIACSVFQFSTVLTELLPVIDSSSCRAKYRSVVAVCLISVVYRWTINSFSPSVCTQSFMHSLASNCNGYVLKRKIMLFSCWIRKLIKCQRWIFNSVFSWMWPCKWWPLKQLWNTVWKIQLFFILPF